MGADWRSKKSERSAEERSRYLVRQLTFLRTLPGVVLAALTPAIAVAATILPDEITADPADRILIATAAAYGARFITRDRAIHRYAKTTSYLRCIAC
ncbi:MAG: PIN domain-containing protein [Candidatus Eremiobacteraeota bacterium]|nr:PIN domain-containing protein [Candidatus Eremiobacteraeota bacterium]